MGQRTPLYDQHLALGAKMVDFGGWDMPLHYGSQVEEHHQVRRDCGVFDVSHMTVVDVAGAQAADYLRRLLANDVARLQSVGKALYTAMLNERGGVVDDLIVYLTDWGYRLVVNAATRENDLAWMQRQAAGFAVEIRERPELAMLAIQGPSARERTAELVDQNRASLIEQLKPFQGLAEGDWFIGRTGYTGEDGLEIILPAEQAPDFLSELVGAGIPPIGLGARDTLRLEAGLNLYGQDMDEDVSPLAANMGWTVAWEPAERDFVGRQALEQQRAAGDLPRSSAWFSKSVASCARTRLCGSPGWAMVKSPAAVSRLRLASRSPWRGCRPAPASAPRSRFAASGIRYAWCSRPSCVTARYWCKFGRRLAPTASPTVDSLEDLTR